MTRISVILNCLVHVWLNFNKLTSKRQYMVMVRTLIAFLLLVKEYRNRIFPYNPRISCPKSVSHEYNLQDNKRQGITVKLVFKNQSAGTEPGCAPDRGRRLPV